MKKGKEGFFGVIWGFIKEVIDCNFGEMCNEVDIEGYFIFCFFVEFVYDMQEFFKFYCGYWKILKVIY